MKNKIVTINYDLKQISPQAVDDIADRLRELVNKELPDTLVLIVPEGITISPIVTFLDRSNVVTKVIK
jgi:hypothetical protein